MIGESPRQLRTSTPLHKHPAFGESRGQQPHKLGRLCKQDESGMWDGFLKTSASREEFHFRKRHEHVGRCQFSRVTSLPADDRLQCCFHETFYLLNLYLMTKSHQSRSACEIKVCLCVFVRISAQY